MSDIMKSIPFGQLMEWILAEHKETGQVFGIQKAYVADPSKTVEIFGRKLENPVGPAAGPHTQLAQNLVAAYYAGARFFELKTVQKMDGPELSACIPKPCIVAEDEAYNCEWSTELYVPQAMEEYIKGWMILHVIAKEFGLGSPDGFQFNMSCGYNLEGIQDKKIDDFIEGMKDAGDTAIFKECREWLLKHVDLFEHVTREDIEAIPSEICNSITLSTMHGCPPQEIENIVTYLLKEKHIHTYVKCNPTLLGYEFVRKAMDDLGYDYMAFTDFHFKDDLQYEDAVPMLKRLMDVAAQEGLSFGVKLTNTFPVDIKRQELPGEEMYMSGKALFPLSISVAARLAESFDGKLPMSFSGGADQKNIDQIVDCGIWPVTVATVLLKPGGYKWMTRIAEKTAACQIGKSGEVHVERVTKLAADALENANYQKNSKKAGKRKEEKSPLLDCLSKDVVSFGKTDRIYIATMYPFDEESRKRVQRHRKMRQGKGFETVECYTGLDKIRLPENCTVLLECMSNLVANEMFQEEGAHENTVEAVLKGVRHIREQAGNLVIVTNEIFSEAADYQGETELYQEYLGQINQKIAEIADQVVEVVYGIPVYHKNKLLSGEG